MDKKILLLLAALISVLMLLILDVPAYFPTEVDAPAAILPSAPRVVARQPEIVAQDAPLPATSTPEEASKVQEIVETSIRAPLTSSSYVTVRDSCGPRFDGACVALRRGPSTSTDRILSARNGMVLKTDETVERDGRTWYRIVFDEWLRYPERVNGAWYIAAEFVDRTEASETSQGTSASTTKHIEVHRGDQMLYAYDGDTLFMKEKISTGLDLTPTPRGTFTILRKTPSRYMQGPLPGISDQYFDLPGVPWNLYFTKEGGAIHGAYWHDHFGEQWSHGCINLPTEKARKLYEWAPVGTAVIVRD